MKTVYKIEDDKYEHKRILYDEKNNRLCSIDALVLISRKNIPLHHKNRKMQLLMCIGNWEPGQVITIIFEDN